VSTCTAEKPCLPGGSAWKASGTTAHEIPIEQSRIGMKQGDLGNPGGIPKLELRG
jgi:hypothetical protein